MATEACDCCHPTFEPEYISIEITLHGKYGKELMNGAVSRMSIECKPTKQLQRGIANKIAKMLKLKVWHAI